MEHLDIKELMHETKVQHILEDTGLDFRIDPIPLTGVHGNKIIESGYIGLTNSRTQKVLHAAKPGYHISQNDVLVRLALEGASQFGDLTVSKGGPINGGKRTFLQLEMKAKHSIRNDEIKRYITILDSNDGSSAVSFGYGNQTASCLNQFSKFLKERMFKIYHSAEMEEKLEQVPDIIFECLKRDFRLMKLYTEFSETSIHKDLAHELVNSLIGVDRTMTKEQLEEMEVKSRKLNIMNSMYDNINKEILNKGENMWGLFSGITSYTTHDKSTPKRKFGGEESLFTGSVASMNESTLDFVMDKAELVW